MARKIRIDASAATQIRQVAAVNAAARADHSVAATLGWIFVLLAGGALVLIVMFQNQEATSQERALQARLYEVDQKAGTLEREYKAETDTLKLGFDEVARKYDPLVKEVPRLEAEVQQLRVAFAVLSKEAESQRTAVEAPPVAAMATEAVETVSPAVALAQKSQSLSRQREQLIQQYKERYAEVKKEYDGAQLNEEPERIKHMFVRFRKSPFGPATAYFAAEKLLFNKNDFLNAKVYYGNIIKEFPDSYYAKYAAIRVDELGGKAQAEYEAQANKNKVTEKDTSTTHSTSRDKEDRPVAPSGFIVKNKGNRNERWYKVYELGFVPYNVPPFAK